MKYRVNPVTFYLAGGLFNHKDLVGNRLLARKIATISGNRYRFVLPQDVESGQNGLGVRDLDIFHLIQSQAVLFNFDGADLDSGTVAEFMMTVFLGIPALLLRTDFRSGGDNPSGDPWNLMCSGYPGTETLLINAMDLYQKSCHGRNEKEDSESFDLFYESLARPILERFDALLSEPPRFQELDEAFSIYRHFIRRCVCPSRPSQNREEVRSCEEGAKERPEPIQTGRIPRHSG